VIANDEKIPGNSRRRAWISLLLRVGGSVLALAVLFHFLPLAEVWRTLRSLPAQIWLLVVAGYLAAHVIAINKWRLMVNLAGAGLNFRQAMRCYFAGLFSTLLLPSIVGGDVVRAAVAFREGQSRAAVVLGGLIDRSIDFVALALLAALGAALVPVTLPAETRHVFFVAAIALALLAAVLLPAVIWFPVRRLRFRLRRKAGRLRGAARSMLRKPHYVFAALCLGLIAQTGFVALTARVAIAGGLYLPFRAWLFAWPLAKFSGLIPVTQGGIGVREAALVILLKPFGARPAKAAAVGLAWEAVILIGGLIAGLAAFLLGQSSARTAAGTGAARPNHSEDAARENPSVPRR
jgi:glycosyltransferase 2 family protein